MSSPAVGKTAASVRFALCARTEPTGPTCFGPKESRRGKPKTQEGYRPLLVEIIRFFETGQPPVPNEETLEIFAFMDAAQRSKAAGGAPIKLP